MQKFKLIHSLKKDKQQKTAFNYKTFGIYCQEKDHMAFIIDFFAYMTGTSQVRTGICIASTEPQAQLFNKCHTTMNFFEA